MATEAAITAKPAFRPISSDTVAETLEKSMKRLLTLPLLSRKSPNRCRRPASMVSRSEGGAGPISGAAAAPVSSRVRTRNVFSPVPWTMASG